MNQSCTGTRRDGSPCAARALPGEALCWAHSPTTTEKRRAVRSAGGIGRSNLSRAIARLPKESRTLLDDLYEVFADLRAGRIEAKDATALATVAKVIVSVHETALNRAEFEQAKADLEAEIVRSEQSA